MRLVVNPTLRVEVTYDTCRRGVGRRRATTNDPELVRFVLQMLGKGGVRVPSGTLLEGLRRVGAVVPADEAPRPVDLRIELGGSVARLVPNRERQRKLPATTLIPNPRMWKQRGSDPPRAIASRLARAPSQQGTRWVEDPTTRVLAPFTLPADAEAVLRGDRAVASLRPSRRELLRRAGVLLAPDEVARARAAWSAHLTACRAQLARDDFTVIRDVLNPVYLAEFRAYTRRLRAEGYLQHGDPRVADRLVKHDEPWCRFLHGELVRVLNRVVPAPIKASYSYLAVYLPGAVLTPHRDREQCAWNLSLVLDADPETDREDAWPIWLGARGGNKAARLGIGDGVLYRGVDLMHWRDAQPARHESTVCFFHFVSRRFRGRLT